MNNLYYMGLYGGDEYYRLTGYPEYQLERNDTSFYNENEGFMKGNIQKNSYSPYKSYNPTMPSVSNDRERFLLEIQKYGFYLIDLGLYLDLHPNDKEALALFNENRAKYYRLVSEFNKNYYPLMLADSNGSEIYKWSEGNFPWMRGS